ncbi:MFS transporter [Streptomyces sp. WAC 01325]|uniref:MFS transporter n=1 Tax=Streptomyces sp. WAC 01325 TaxID=2203202 RepID=UPI000F89BEED|nr:MFS transporter [Streptomyces sp. WAC 01325]RSM97192.1 MFS transporter [Streptomyces sp. WAC 01325]
MADAARSQDDTAHDGGKTGRFTGMGPFMLVWSGQAVSLVGNSVLRFAFVFETWSATGRATALTTLSLCALLPQVLLSPLAGAFVDRVSRRTALQLADGGGLLVVALLAVLHFTGGLHTWEVYEAVMLLGGAAAFQFPALGAAVPLLVDKRQLQRANSLLASAKSTADVGGPALGGLLVAFSGIGFILVADLVSFALALAAIRVVRMKGDNGPTAKAAGGPRKKLIAEAVEGMRFLFRFPSLRDLMLAFCFVNLVMVFGFAAVQPMVLARSGGETSALASVNTAIGVGGVAGGLLMAAWSGPRNRARGMLLGIIGMCLSAQVAMALAGGVVGWCAAILVGAALMPMINGTMQAIVQTKVPQEWHGRVFGAVVFLSQLSVPLATAVSGPLADHVFEPQAADGAGIFVVLGPLLGDGPGSGMAAMLLIAGLCGITVAALSMSQRTVREIDSLLPDVTDDSAEPTDDDSARPGDPGAPGSTDKPDNPENKALVEG